jgi:DNA-binding IclR family transcriptional regulator
MPGSKYTQETVAKVIDLYKQNTKLSEIIEQTGVPRSTVYWMLRQHGVKLTRQPGVVREAATVEGWLEVIEQAVDQIRRHLR